MLRLFFSSTAITAAAIAAPGPAAEGPLQVTSSMMVSAKERAADGTTRVRLVPAHRVVPGDRVTLVIAFRNTGAQPLSNVVIANPVPAALSYSAATNGTPAPDVSVDGKSFAPIGALRVASPAGPRPATLADITHVRWRVPTAIAPGASGRFAFDAILK